MRLRDWQSECASKALEIFNSGNRNFFVVASPGSGKTFMAAEVAARLLKQGVVDLVLCLSPSSEVRDGIFRTFNLRIPDCFHRGIGASGYSLTYQRLLALDDSFLEPAKRKRLLVICDEIHHCSGGGVTVPNAWGSKILNQILDLATFTLCMSGTPWRTDQFPIALAKYDNNNELIIDYQYSLTRAVTDKVCRQPVICLIDNDACKINQQSYKSIHEALTKTDLMYQHILNNENALKHILRVSIDKLMAIRLATHDAGGLVVAHSIEHARKIKKILEKEFQQSVELVTYREKNPQQIIEVFRRSDTPWIVSVGMIAEGTDIPRLQVCCHITTVRTEMYFRQILGRVLRARPTDNAFEGFLYTFAEPQLKIYAERIQNELPDCEVLMDVIAKRYFDNNAKWLNGSEKQSILGINTDSEITEVSEVGINSRGTEMSSNFHWDFTGSFREQIIKSFAQI